MSRFEEKYWEIMHARNPNSIFGTIVGSNITERLANLREIYELVRGEIDSYYFSDNLDDESRAREVLEKLELFFKRAQDDIRQGIYAHVVYDQARTETITSPSGERYIVSIDEQLADAKSYRIYPCVRESTGRSCILQIGKSIDCTPAIDRNAYVLGELRSYARILEEEYARVKKDPDSMLNYHLGFPDLVESFTNVQQGNRKINILTFHNVEACQMMVPLSRYRRKENRRIDVKTSVWIMGKILKIIGFAHSQGFSVAINNGNLLIDPEKHYVLVFDWADTVVYPDTIPLHICRLNVKLAAHTVCYALATDVINNKVYEDINESVQPYLEYLSVLSRGFLGDAASIHADFYKLVDQIWERKYHPFTTIPI